MFGHLWSAAVVCDHFDNIIKWQKRVALELGINVLALGAGCQQLHQSDVVCQSPVLILPRRHHILERRKRGTVIIEDQHVFSSVHQLQSKTNTQCLIYHNEHYRNSLSCEWKCLWAIGEE